MSRKCKIRGDAHLTQLGVHAYNWAAMGFLNFKYNLYTLLHIF